MKQELVDGFLAYHAAVPAAFSAAQRVAIALRLLELEHEWAFATPSESPPGPAAPTRFFEVTDWGLRNEEWLRQTLQLNGYEAWHSADLDTIMCEWGKTKVVTPLDPDVPPFYLINGTRESIYELRLRIKALFIDEWNTWSRDEVVARLRVNNDVIQPL